MLKEIVATLSEDCGTSQKIQLFQAIQITQAASIGRDFKCFGVFVFIQSFKAASKVAPYQLPTSGFKVEASSQTDMEKGQRINKWSTVSSCNRQREHQLGLWNCFFCRVSQVGTLFSRMDHTKSLPLAGIFSFHSLFHQHFYSCCVGAMLS
jgi:hypothetical protein